MKTEYKLKDGSVFKTKDAIKSWIGWGETLYKTHDSRFRLTFFDGSKWECKTINEEDAVKWIDNNGFKGVNHDE